MHGLLIFNDVADQWLLKETLSQTKYSFHALGGNHLSSAAGLCAQALLVRGHTEETLRRKMGDLGVRFGYFRSNESARKASRRDLIELDLIQETKIIQYCTNETATLYSILCVQRTLLNLLIKEVQAREKLSTEGGKGAYDDLMTILTDMGASNEMVLSSAQRIQTNINSFAQVVRVLK